MTSLPLFRSWLSEWWSDESTQTAWLRDVVYETLAFRDPRDCLASLRRALHKDLNCCRNCSNGFFCLFFLFFVFFPCCYYYNAWICITAKSQRAKTTAGFSCTKAKPEVSVTSYLAVPAVEWFPAKEPVPVDSKFSSSRMQLCLSKGKADLATWLCSRDPRWSVLPGISPSGAARMLCGLGSFFQRMAHY